LNAMLIPAQAQGSAAGFSYTWNDSDALASGQMYFYWLEAVNTDGSTSLHGPASLIYAVPTAVEMSQLHAGSGAQPPAGLWLALLLPLLLAGGMRLRRSALRG